MGFHRLTGMGLHCLTGMGLHRLAGMEVKFIHIVDLIGALNQRSLRIFGKGEKTVLLLHLLPADHLSFSIKSSPF